MPVDIPFAVTNTTNAFHFAISGGTTLDFDEAALALEVVPGQTRDFYASAYGFAPTRFTGTSMTSPAGATDAATAIALIQALAPGLTEPGDLIVGGTITGNRVYTEEGTPLDALELTSKTYVDALAGNGVLWKENVRAASTGNVALTGEQTLDGIALVSGDRALLTSQTAPAENGIYVVSAGAWSRSPDADGSPEVELKTGAAVSVSEGALYENTIWALVSYAGIIDVSAQTWTQLNLVAAGFGLTQVGNTVLVDQATDFTWTGLHRFAGDSVYVGTSGIGALWDTAAHDGELRLNFDGYQEGILYRRQAAVYDGQENRIALFLRNTVPTVQVGSTLETESRIRLTTSATGSSSIYFDDTAENRGGITYYHSGTERLALMALGADEVVLTSANFYPNVAGGNTLGKSDARWLSLFSSGLDVTGAASVNTSGTGSTLIGNTSSAVSILGTVNINTSGTSTTAIGSLSSTVIITSSLLQLNSSTTGDTFLGNGVGSLTISGNDCRINEIPGLPTLIGNDTAVLDLIGSSITYTTASSTFGSVSNATTELQVLTTNTGTGSLMFGDSDAISQGGILYYHDTLGPERLALNALGGDRIHLTATEFYPNVDNTISLGKSSNRWTTLHSKGLSVNGDVFINQSVSNAILIGAEAITSSATLAALVVTLQGTLGINTGTTKVTTIGGSTLNIEVTTNINTSNTRDTFIGNTTRTLSLTGSTISHDAPESTFGNTSNETTELQVLTTNEGTGSLFFGDSDANSQGGISYDHFFSRLSFRVAGSELVHCDGLGLRPITDATISLGFIGQRWFSVYTLGLNNSGTDSTAIGNATGTLTLTGSSITYNAPTNTFGSTSKTTTALHVLTTNTGTGSLLFGDSDATGRGGILYYHDTLAPERLALNALAGDRVYLTGTDFYPNGTVSLGKSDARWSAMYSSGLDVIGTVNIAGTVNVNTAGGGSVNVGADLDSDVTIQMAGTRGLVKYDAGASFSGGSEFGLATTKHIHILSSPFNNRLFLYSTSARAILQVGGTTVFDAQSTAIALGIAAATLTLTGSTITYNAPTLTFGSTANTTTALHVLTTNTGTGSLQFGDSDATGRGGIVYYHDTLGPERLALSALGGDQVYLTDTAFYPSGAVSLGDTSNRWSGVYGNDLNIVGTANVNASGLFVTNIGNPSSAVGIAGTISISGTTTIVGTTNVNTTNALSTSIGNATGTVTILGPTLVNTTGTQSTEIGNATGTVTVLGPTLINTTGTKNTEIGNTDPLSLLTLTGNLTTNGYASINRTGTSNTDIGNATGFVDIQGDTRINQSGLGGTTIGNASVSVQIFGTTAIEGDLDINRTGGFNTDIGNIAGGTVNIRGATNINTLNSYATAIGDGTSTVTILGTTDINSSGTSNTVIGNATGTLTLTGSSITQNTPTNTFGNTSNATTVLQVLTTNTGTGSLMFGDSDAISQGGVLYYHDTLGPERLALNALGGDRVFLTSTEMYPNGAVSLGDTSNRWSTVYSSGLDVSGTTTIAGTTNVNVSNTENTSIGNSTGTVTILGPTLVNTTGTKSTSIGNTTAALQFTGVTSTFSNANGTLAAFSTLDSGPLLRVGTTANTSSRIRITTSAAGAGVLAFDDAVTSVGGLTYDHNTDTLIIRAAAANEVVLSSTAFYPAVNDGNSLGLSTNRWLGLFSETGTFGNTGQTTTNVRFQSTNTGTASIFFDDSDATNRGGMTYYHDAAGPERLAFRALGNEEAILTATNFYPASSGGNTLGQSANRWASLFSSGLNVTGDADINITGGGFTTIGASTNSVSILGGTNTIHGLANINRTSTAETNIGNTTGNTTVYGNLVWAQPYAEVYWVSNASASAIVTMTSSITTVDHYVKANGTNTGSMFVGMDGNGTNNRIRYTGSRTRMFHCGCTITFVTAGANDTAIFVLVKNGTSGAPSTGTLLPASIVRTNLTNAAQVRSTAIHCMISLAQNDYFELWVGNQTDADDVTITEMNMFALAHLN